MKESIFLLNENRQEKKEKYKQKEHSIFIFFINMFTNIYETCQIIHKTCYEKEIRFLKFNSTRTFILLLFFNIFIVKILEQKKSLKLFI